MAPLTNLFLLEWPEAMMREAEWYCPNLPNMLAQSLLISVRRGTPLEPNWITDAINKAHQEGTTFEYQLWVAVRDIAIFLGDKKVSVEKES
jgi:hypothetical protein